MRFTQGGFAILRQIEIRREWMSAKRNDDVWWFEREHVSYFRSFPFSTMHNQSFESELQSRNTKQSPRSKTVDFRRRINTVDCLTSAGSPGVSWSISRLCTINAAIECQSNNPRSFSVFPITRTCCTEPGCAPSYSHECFYPKSHRRKKCFVNLYPLLFWQANPKKVTRSTNIDIHCAGSVLHPLRYFVLKMFFSSRTQKLISSQVPLPWHRLRSSSRRENLWPKPITMLWLVNFCAQRISNVLQLCWVP